MCDHWMPTVRLPLTPEQYRQLPRHPAYKYEYVAGQALLTPKSRHYHAVLDLKPGEGDPEVPLRRTRPEDCEGLVSLFAAAFRYTQPYGSLDETTLIQASREALERTRTDGDGPWIQQASLIAGQPGAAPAGAIFVTLLPGGDLSDWDSYHWATAPPADAIQRRLGCPHLTWIFVEPSLAGRNLGTILLGAAVRELAGMGYTQLVSTFMSGNDSSMLWHWRNGFRLLQYPGSLRRKRARSPKT
jgi:GNAT superfamily N-acetyltransferase